MKDYDVKLYKGWPASSGDTLEEMVEKGLLKLVDDVKNDGYKLSPGVYSCYISGEGIYSTLKVFSVKEGDMCFCLEELVRKTIVLLQTDGQRPEGYQPTVVAPNPPKYFRRTQKDEVLCIWPDEILDLYATAAVPKHHQCMKQDILEHRLQSMENKWLYYDALGISEHYGFNIPVVILSKEALSGANLWENLERLKAGKKVNIFYQAQVHGNEPAACDGALAVLQAFCEQEELQLLLDQINLVVIPRANPEAAYLYRRMAFDNIDLNRDHMACEAHETRLLHRAFQTLEPEVVLDGHEFTFYDTESEGGKGFVSKGCEIMSSPATSLNVSEAVRMCGYAICEKVFKELTEKSYGIYHFGAAVKASFGRGFYGLHQCLSFLIETRGIGGGRYGYEKRIAAQKDTVLSYIKNAAIMAEDIKETVRAARKQCVSPCEVVLQHGSSGETCTPYKGVREQYYLDGSLRIRVEEAMVLGDMPLRTRKSARSYVMAADTEHMDQIIEKVKGLGCQVEKLDPGMRLLVEPYLYAGLREAGCHEKDIITALIPAAPKVFENGAYLFKAMDYRGILLAMLMEPDVTDTVGTKGSLFQQGLLDYDEETGLFPLYRTDWL